MRLVEGEQRVACDRLSSHKQEVIQHLGLFVHQKFEAVTVLQLRGERGSQRRDQTVRQPKGLVCRCQLVASRMTLTLRKATMQASSARLISSRALRIKRCNPQTKLSNCRFVTMRL